MALHLEVFTGGKFLYCTFKMASCMLDNGYVIGLLSTKLIHSFTHTELPRKCLGREDAQNCRARPLPSVSLSFGVYLHDSNHINLSFPWTLKPFPNWVIYMTFAIYCFILWSLVVFWSPTSIHSPQVRAPSSFWAIHADQHYQSSS